MSQIPDADGLWKLPENTVVTANDDDARLVLQALNLPEQVPDHPSLADLPARIAIHHSHPTHWIVVAEHRNYPPGENVLSVHCLPKSGFTLAQIEALLREHLHS